MGEKAIYEPGTLEHTRKNIGPINKEEAKKMTEVLGGEIFTEKAAPVDTSHIPKAPIKHRAPSAFAPAAVSNNNAASKTRNKGLPIITQKTRQRIDKLMMSPEYHIKPSFGLFNFIYSLQKKNKERVSPKFTGVILHKHLDHMDAFITVIKTLFEMAPSSYKQRIQNENDLKFRFMRKVSKWSTKELNLLYIDINKNIANTTIEDLVPFTREIYGMLAQILYLGEAKVSFILKEIYTDQTKFPDANKTKIASFARDAVHEWVYLYNEVVKGMYPLLMRMCATSYEIFPDFFITNAKKILAFLNKNKFDLLVIEKNASSDTQTADKSAAANKKKNEVSPSSNMAIVKSGISLLNTLFPQAGFDKMEQFPDMYPYFQPLFNFADGFNLLNPENPLQITVVLIRIVEDLFHGCRNISFATEHDANDNIEGTDTIQSTMNDWSVYYEMFFNKLYATPLTDYVNELNSQSDFAYTAFGKKTINKLLWFTKYYFLPLFKFEKLLLEHPDHDTSYPALYSRVQSVCDALTNIAKNIDKASKTRGAVSGIRDPWEHYRFDISNPLSERLDALLAAKRSGQNITATNANLLKYTLLILSVLDWWLNDATSPAYKADPMKIYRRSEKDGKPLFFAPVRDDQQKLFSDNIQIITKK